MTDSASTSASRAKHGAFAITALILGATAIGFSPIFVRLSEVGPIASAFWRVALAAPALWLWAVVSPSRKAIDTAGSASAWGLLVVGLSFAGDLAFWHWSVRLTTVANATLLANLAAVFVTLFSWLVLRQRITSTFLAGMAIALAGTATLINRSFSVSSAHLLGDLLGLITAMFYTAYLLATKRLRDAGYPTAIIVSRGTLITALALFPIALLSGESLLPPTLYGWWVLLGLALVSHAGGQTLIAYALAHLPATFSSVTLLIEPVVAALLAWALFAEELGPLELTGGVLVLAGIYLAGRGSA